MLQRTHVAVHCSSLTPPPRSKRTEVDKLGCSSMVRFVMEGREGKGVASYCEDSLNPETLNPPDGLMFCSGSLADSTSLSGAVYLVVVLGLIGITVEPCQGHSEGFPF